MHFEPTAVPAEIAPLFRRFVAITGWKPWKGRLAALEQRVKDNPFLGEYFAERYPLELEMEQLHRRLRRGGKFSLPATYREVALLSFVATVSRVYRRLSAQGQRRLAGMLRSGLDAEYGLASLAHEMGIATHLMAQGFDVIFSDIESGGGFDLLAERDGVEIEIECKIFSGDMGRKVHLRRLYQLGGRVYPLMTAALNKRPGGQLARVVLPGRLQGSDQQQRDICDRLARVLQDGTSELGPEPCSIEYRTFSLTGSPFETTEPEGLEREIARQFVEREVGLPIEHVVMLFRAFHGAVVVAVESQQPDSMMRGLVRDIKRAAKRQLTGTRPSAICVEFLDITEAQLVEVADLQIATCYLLNREDWRHVHTMAYFTPGHLAMSRDINEDRVTRSVQKRGRPYVFKNPHHELAGDARLSIF